MLFMQILNFGLQKSNLLEWLSKKKWLKPLRLKQVLKLMLFQLKRKSWELEQLLLHPEPLVRRGALLDLGATGWTASLPAIEAATVESSLKLVALRGLAEQSGDSTILDVMDRLL